MGKVYLHAPRFPFFKSAANAHRNTFALSRTHLRFPCYRWFLMLVAVTILFHAYPSGVNAQGRIIAIERNLRPLKTLAEAQLKLVRGATRRSEPTETIPIDLAIGDALSGGSKEVTVKLSCSNATVLVVSGVFLIRFLGEKKEGGCHIYQHPKLGSTVNVSAGQPTSIQMGQSGEIRLGSRRTKYEVSSPIAEDASADTPPSVLVFEGEVDVDTPNFFGTVNAGKKLATETESRPRIRELNERDFLQSAHLLARVDAIQADNVTDIFAAYRKLVSLHQEVLKRPDNLAALAALKRARQDMGIADILVGLKSGTKDFAQILFGNSCKEPMTVRFATENLPLARFLTPAEVKIPPGGQILTRVEFDASGLQSGSYSGLVVATCVDCVKCRMEPRRWLVKVVVQ